LTDVAKSMVVGIADFLKVILAQITQLIAEISIPLTLVLILTGSILCFSQLNRRLSRDFVVLSMVLTIVNRIFK